MTSLWEYGVEVHLTSELFKRSDLSGRFPKIDAQVFQTIKVQLLALNLIDAKYLKKVDGKFATFWSLTPSGRNLMFETRTVRKDGGESS